MIGLLGGTALAVDRGGRDLVGQALIEPGRARDVEGLLPCLGDATPEDLLDLGGIEPGPLDELDLGGAEQLGGVHSSQHPVPLPERGPYCLDDHRLRHVPPFRVGCPRAGSEV